MKKKEKDLKEVDYEEIEGKTFLQDW